MASNQGKIAGPETKILNCKVGVIDYIFKVCTADNHDQSFELLKKCQTWMESSLQPRG